MYGIVGAVVIIKNKQQTSPEPKHRFRPADSTRGGPAPSPALPLAPPLLAGARAHAHRAPTGPLTWKSVAFVYMVP